MPDSGERKVRPAVGDTDRTEQAAPARAAPIRAGEEPQRPSGGPRAVDRPAGDTPPIRRLLLWTLGLVGAFVTAVVAGLAANVVQSLTTPPQPTPSASPATRVTAVRLVRPFDDTGRLLPPYQEAGRSAGGRCVESYQSSDPDAQRCFSQSQVFDPCWSLAEVTVCLRSPWDSAAWIIEDIEGARAVRRSMGDAPWALEVRNPFDERQTLRCGAAGGANGTVAGMRIGWRCSPADAAEFRHVGDLIGLPRSEEGKPWTIFFAQENNSDVREAEVVTVWR
ncbi:hypothetical protein OG559_10825 [Micromonospora sp. NBC_01405]|uniref:hypothetical protein n=1 Tax=Micromonospora sp. NBC_01405 TaxID=2903589 RepID=UPI00324DDE3A